MRTYSFEVASVLPIGVTALLASLSMASVNAELAPWVRMTAPRAWRHRPIPGWPVGHALFRSHVLLLGFVLVDTHSFRFARIDPQRGFEERSTSLANRVWHHTRWVEPVAGGCRVHDRVAFVSRLPGLDVVMRPIYLAIFQNRHRRLRRQ